jgi:hypothetical protein
VGNVAIEVGRGNQFFIAAETPFFLRDRKIVSHGGAAPGVLQGRPITPDGICTCLP